MPQITLDIPQSKYAFFMELLESFSFIKKVKVKDQKKIKAQEDDENDFIPRTKEQIKADLIGAFKEAEEIIAGTKKGRPAQALIDELRSYQH